MSSITAQDREFARILLKAIDGKDEGAIANLLAAIHDRAVACAVVRSEREQASASEGKKGRART